jgi:hypothetical protein
VRGEFVAMTPRMRVEIRESARRLAEHIDGRIADEVYARMSGTVTLDEGSK